MRDVCSSFEQRHIDSTRGRLSAINPTMCDPAIYLDFNGGVSDGTCGNDNLFSIILRNI